MIAYYNGNYLNKSEIAISPDDRGFLFADGVYEVIRAYNGRIFRLDDHLKRFKQSCEAIKIHNHDTGKLLEVARKLIDYNQLHEGDALLYMQITRGAAPSRGHRFPQPPPPVTVYASAEKFTPKLEKLQKGIKLITAQDNRWQWCNIKSIALLPNVLATQLANEQGAEQALYTRDGSVTEASKANFFAVFGDLVQTHPEDNTILGGVSRKVILELCEKLSIKYRETAILQSQLNNITESFVSSTTTEVLPVIQIDNTMIGNGVPGAITHKLQDAFETLTHE